MLEVTFNDILEAHSTLAPVVRETPWIRSVDLSEETGVPVGLKLENLLQPVGSFKLRGAYNKIAGLSGEERSRGLLAVSAGNHAQAVAYCARLFDAEATVFMPENTPRVKVERTRRFGAHVVLEGADYDESEALAHAFEQDSGKVFVHPFDDAAIIAGAGTVGLEIMWQMPECRTLIVPVGGGGLISGCAIAAKGIDPKVRVIGVQPENSAPFCHARQAGRFVDTPVKGSLADALVGRLISEEFWTFFDPCVDDLVTVNEEVIAAAVYWVFKRHGLVIEGGAAVGIAALLEHKIDLAGAPTAVVVTGCGLDTATLVDILARFE